MSWLLLIGVLVLINKSMPCALPSFANLTIQTNFSLHDFLGVWYEIEWFTTEVHNNSDRWDDFTQIFEWDYNSTERLLVSGRARSFHDKECFSFGPWLIIANDSAKMILETKNLNSSTYLNWPYYILKTDYNHYALIYACMSENYKLNIQCVEPVLWVFSRTRSLSMEDLNELDNYIENILCINVTTLNTTLHNENPCYPFSSLGMTMYPINFILFFILLILYL